MVAFRRAKDYGVLPAKRVIRTVPKSQAFRSIASRRRPGAPSRSASLLFSLGRRCREHDRRGAGYSGTREEMCIAGAPPSQAELTRTFDAQSSAHTGTPPRKTADLPYHLTAQGLTNDGGIIVNP